MSKVFVYETIPSYLIICIPIFLITGPFLSDLSISIVSCIFLVNSISNKLYKYYNNVFAKIFFLFCLILIISSLLSNNALISLKNSFFYFRFGIFSLCFWYLLEKKKKFIKIFFLFIFNLFFLSYY